MSEAEPVLFVPHIVFLHEFDVNPVEDKRDLICEPNMNDFEAVSPLV